VNDLINQFVYEEEQSERLDLYLARKLPDFSRSQIQRLIKIGQVLVDDVQPRKTGQMLEHGNRIRVEVPPPEPLDLIPEEDRKSVV